MKATKIDLIELRTENGRVLGSVFGESEARPSAWSWDCDLCALDTGPLPADYTSAARALTPLLKHLEQKHEVTW